MKINIILAHPDNKSFSHAIAQTAVEQLKKNGYDIIFHDLCRENFDCILPANELQKDVILPPVIKQYCDEICAADGIIVVHPNWWGQPPAILKGWIDRIIRRNFAYKFLEGDQGEGVPVGLLKAKVAMVFNTANTSVEREMNVFHDPLQGLWKDCIFDLCGVPVFYRKMFTIVVTSSMEERKEWLNQVQSSVNYYFPKI